MPAGQDKRSVLPVFADVLILISIITDTHEGMYGASGFELK